MALNEQSLYKIMFANYNEILSINDVTRILNVSDKSVISLLKDGKIKSFKIGQQYRIPKLALIEYVLKSSEYTKLDFEKWINKELCQMLGVKESELKYKV